MNPSQNSPSAFFTLRLAVALSLGSAALLLGLFGLGLFSGSTVSAQNPKAEANTVHTGACVQE